MLICLPQYNLTMADYTNISKIGAKYPHTKIILDRNQSQ